MIDVQVQILNWETGSEYHKIVVREFNLASLIEALSAINTPPLGSLKTLKSTNTEVIWQETNTREHSAVIWARKTYPSGIKITEVE